MTRFILSKYPKQVFLEGKKINFSTLIFSIYTFKLEKGFWMTQKNMFWNMFSFVFLGYVSIRELVEILMKSKSRSPQSSYQWFLKETYSVREHFAPCSSQSGAPSPHVALRHGRNARWPSRMWCATGSRPLSFTEFPGRGLLKVCTSLTGENRLWLFIHLHPAHCHALAEMLLPLCSPATTAGVVGAVCGCLHTLPHVTIRKQHLSAFSSP